MVSVEKGTISRYEMKANRWCVNPLIMPAFCMKEFIQIQNLTKEYSEGPDRNTVQVFSNLSLSVERGKSLAIVGPQGV